MRQTPSEQAPNDALDFDSCPSATFCMAVGTSGNGSLAEAWNGHAWRVVATPNVAPRGYVVLASVACPSTGLCVAAGYYNTTGTNGESPLVEEWTGGSWVRKPVAVPSGGSLTELSGVSCASVASCMAVGSYTNGHSASKGLAEHWNGKGWAMDSPPVSGVLNAVICRPAWGCMVLGQTSAAADFADFWNGKSWSKTTIADPAGGGELLTSLACPANTYCVAVGAELTSSIVGTSAIWNGAKWVVKAAALPKGAAESELNGVHCALPKNCVAVGSYLKGSAASNPAGSIMSEVWNGTSWRVVSPLQPTGATEAELFQVRCTAVTSCVAVGTYEAGPKGSFVLVEHWNGSSWRLQTAPAPINSLQTVLVGASCESASSCQAVGGYYLDEAIFPLGESWNGTSWTVRDVPSPTGAILTEIDGISCAGGGCLAVGFNGNITGSGAPLSVRWNGRAWSSNPAPAPSGAVSQLAGVSCAPSGGCMAVGTTETSTSALSLVDWWSGSSWKSLKSPTLPRGASNASLEAVSCESSTACTAVGEYQPNPNSGGVPLIAVWNGTTWSLATAPTPAGGANYELTTVSCASASACVAIGDFEVGQNGQHTFSDVWNGTSWSLHATVNPASAEFVSSIDCPSATSCTAVGDTETSKAISGYVETWDGTSWKQQASPESSAELAGVTCIAVGSCLVVGEMATGGSLSATEGSW